MDHSSFLQSFFFTLSVMKKKFTEIPGRAFIVKVVSANTVRESSREVIYLSGYIKDIGRGMLGGWVFFFFPSPPVSLVVRGPLLSSLHLHFVVSLPGPGRDAARSAALRARLFQH